MVYNFFFTILSNRKMGRKKPPEKQPGKFFAFVVINRKTVNWKIFFELLCSKWKKMEKKKKNNLTAMKIYAILYTSSILQ